MNVCVDKLEKGAKVQLGHRHLVVSGKDVLQPGEGLQTQMGRLAGPLVVIHWLDGSSTAYAPGTLVQTF